jgi:hypothetical protein
MTIQHRAEAFGTRPVDYARAVLLRDRAAPAPARGASTLDRLVFEQLKRVSNNLNQIAKRLNALQGFTPADLDLALGELRQLVRRLGLDGP